MQLQYLFSHHFFTYSMKFRVWQDPGKRQIDYKKNDPWHQEQTKAKIVEVSKAYNIWLELQEL